jgi:hypothetical protein
MAVTMDFSVGDARSLARARGVVWVALRSAGDGVLSEETIPVQPSLNENAKP